ncbi:TPA_asm: winged helix-turn-helix transcriptional regulator [Geoglobus ahangari pleomorphic virus 1]|uniref:Transcriptional regulator, HxlR family n=2 Tax=root TaxID=1 RepID=A0A0F7IJK0_9EURY|nr:winged helix-turn-helix transcriptional regulator [Geoglobus ahangari]AKG92407.1 transcriptional regulator, HxlR family [Geoglobus ahangari]
MVERPISSIINTLSHSKSLDILFRLKDGGKRWSNLLEVAKDKKTLSHRIRELSNLGLIQIKLVFDTPTGSKIYELTPLGQKIVQLLEQMEKEFEDYYSKAPPKDPEKFINELLDDN